MIDPLLRAVVAEFAQEAGELCVELTRDLLGMEKPKSAESQAEAYERVARRLHTIKGSAATVGLADVADAAHGLESIIDPLRSELSAISGSTVDTILDALDVILARIKAAAKDDDVTMRAEIAALAERLEGIAASEGEVGVRIEDAGASGATPRAEQAGGGAAPAEAGDEGGRDSFRVSSAKVEALVAELERVRELRMRLDGRRRALDKFMTARDADRGSVDPWDVIEQTRRGLRIDAEEAADTVTMLEESIRSIATQPTRIILDPLSRAVRDLARALGKEASFNVVGADVSLDRRVLESLRAPLAQIVRNSVAHGIEAPEVREARGKHREGVIDVRVELLGSSVTIDIGDDGAGLDRRAIVDKAVSLGLATEDERATASDARLAALIMNPGFSTREEVSGSAGRGVGMSIVEAEVRALGGRVEVTSRPLQGTRFALTIPVALGSTPVLLVRTGEDVFGIPLLGVDSGIAVREEMLRNEATLLAFREQLVPVDDLGARLGLREALSVSRGQPVLVVRSAGILRAIAVDEVIGEDVVVVRALPEEITTDVYRGAATMALGEILLVLSPAWLVSSDAASRVPTLARSRVLVVDDSLTARAMYRTVLESAGFTVHVAPGLAKARALLGGGAYDAILVDILLEDGDGLSLVTEIRRKPAMQGVPIVVVSSHDSPEDRARALTVGANRFLAKHECASGRLVSELSDILEKRASA